MNDLSELLPDEIWVCILHFMSFREILLLRLMNKRLKECAFTSLSLIQDKIKLLPPHNMTLPNHKIIGKNPWTNAIDNVGKKTKWINIIWTNKKDILTEIISDMQPRDANRGLAYNGIEWIWIRGPFKSSNKDKTGFETYITIFQNETIFGLCQYLKNYEVEILSKFIDNTCINSFINESSDGVKTLHWISSPSHQEETLEKESSFVTIKKLGQNILSKIIFKWN